MNEVERPATIPEAIQHESLIESFGGIPLSQEENVAVEVLDTLSNLDLKQKKAFFDYFVWHESGTLEPLKRFGEIQEDQDVILDRILSDNDLVDEYNKFYIKYKNIIFPSMPQAIEQLIESGETIEEAAAEFDIDANNARSILVENARKEALKKPFCLEVLNGKRSGKKHLEIANELGIRKKIVDRISKELIALRLVEISPLGRKNAEPFHELVLAVIEEDLATPDNEPRKTAKELAEKFSTSERTIRNARERGRLLNQERRFNARHSKKPNFEKIKARKTKVLDGLNRGLTNRQISVEYGIPFAQVRRDRQSLIKEEKVPKVEYPRKRNKKKLKSILKRHLREMSEGTRINLKEVQRNWGEQISHHSLWSLYVELESEMVVPPIRNVRRKRVK